MSALLIGVLILWAVVEAVSSLRRWWGNLVWFQPPPEYSAPYVDDLSDCVANIAFYLGQNAATQSVFPRAK